MDATQIRGMAGSVLSSGAGTTTMLMPSSSPRCGDGSCFARKLRRQPHRRQTEAGAKRKKEMCPGAGIDGPWHDKLSDNLKEDGR